MSKLTNVKYNKPSFWEDFFGSNWYNEPYSNGFMRSDISKRKGNYVFDIDIPGYSKEDIQVKLDKGYLTVMVEHHQSNSTDTADYEYLHQERYNGQYTRSFYVGCPDDTKATATYHNGVLTVVIPEVTQEEIDKTKYITIN